MAWTELLAVPDCPLDKEGDYMQLDRRLLEAYGIRP